MCGFDNWGLLFWYVLFLIRVYLIMRCVYFSYVWIKMFDGLWEIVVIDVDEFLFI